MTDDKQRIMQLVKEGVITTEEATILLENREKQAEAASDDAILADFYAELADNANAQSSLRDQKYANQKRLEKQLAEKLQNKQTLGDSDTDQVLKQRLTEEIEQLQEQIKQLKKEIVYLDKQLDGEKATETAQTRATATDDKDFLTVTQDFLHSIRQQINQNVAFDQKKGPVPIPRLKTHQYEKTWTYSGEGLSVINLDIAKGDITIETWDRSEVDLTINGKLIGDYEENTPAEALEARSQLTYTDGVLDLKMVSRMLTSNVTLKIPRAVLDYIQVQQLTGKLTGSGLESNDVTIHHLDGNVTFTNLKTQMLELDTKNSRIHLHNVDIKDLMSRSLNGEQRVIGRVANTEIQTVNGDIRLTYKDIPKRILVDTKNGTIKVNIPDKSAVDGFAQTNYGRILFRADDLTVKTIKAEKLQHQKIFQAHLEDYPAAMTLKTMSGDILFKTE